MNVFWKDMMYACVMGLIVPAMVLSAGVAVFGSKNPETEPTVAEIIKEQPALEIPVLTEKGVVRMDLNDYLTGVVLAEMPAAFEPEAHKAQAVVARTYTMRAYRDKPRHDTACVCTDSTCCQGYISPEAYLEKGGSEEGIEKIRKAVLETADLVLTYEGKLIEATYFSCSGGVTEDAVAVWGTDVPYLRSVESPGEENATHYTDTVLFAPEELGDCLDLSGEGYPRDWIGTSSYTDGGGVDEIVICGDRFQGTQVRKLLGLRSTAFEIRWNGECFEITTKGYGHRVGMSQYGADAMAVSGSDFREILAHYYQGTTVASLSD